MRAIHIQIKLAAIFIGLGGWCMLWPASVEAIVMQPMFYIGNETSALYIACFGAQACLLGTVIASSTFKPSTFIIFGLLGSVPFFAFNYYFYFIKSMFNQWMLLDFAGNIGILSLCLFGFRLKRNELLDNQSEYR
jgi:hypothetical protein